MVFSHNGRARVGGVDPPRRAVVDALESRQVCVECGAGDLGGNQRQSVALRGKQ